MNKVWLLGQTPERAQEIRQALMAWDIEVALGPQRPQTFDTILASSQDLGTHTHTDWVAITATPALPEGASMYLLAELPAHELVEALMIERQLRA